MTDPTPEEPERSPAAIRAERYRRKKKAEAEHGATIIRTGLQLIVTRDGGMRLAWNDENFNVTRDDS